MILKLPNCFISKGYLEWGVCKALCLALLKNVPLTKGWSQHGEALLSKSLPCLIIKKYKWFHIIFFALFVTVKMNSSSYPLG